MLYALNTDHDVCMCVFLRLVLSGFQAKQLKRKTKHQLVTANKTVQK